MKKLFVAAMLVAVPAAGADSTDTAPRVVREFAVNQNVQDWWLGGGWSWTDGTLTHFSGSGTAAAEQRTMPPLTVGRTYGINFALTGSTKGTVTVSLGKSKSVPYGWTGDTFPAFITVTDPESLLAFIPTDDYDGSISHIRVVELGDELVGDDAVTLTQGWSRENNAFKHIAGETAGLIVNVPAVAGHTYRVHFGISDATEAHPEWKSGTVSLGGNGKTGWFTRGGNYSFDIAAAQDGPLVIDPVDAKNGGGAGFDGAVSRISVREVSSDVTPAATPAAPAASSGN